VKELINVYQEKGEEFLDDLFNDYLIVTEKLAGSSFSFQKKDNTLQFFKGDSKKPISLIDRTLMVYYEKPIQFISDIPAEILTTVPNNWRFCFQYFVNNKPTNIEYERLPHNSLVLTHIIVKDERGKTAKIIEDPRVLKDWATKFHVTPMQPIFYGKLNSGQKDKIKDFLSVPIEDQMEMFGTSSFAKYLIKGVLNPSLNSTMLHNDLLNPIDSIVFKFYGDDGQSTVSAKMIDPYTSSLMKEKEPVDLRRAPADINEIVLLDILAFLEERGLRRHDVLSATTEERYLELVSALFNDYVERRGEDLQKLDFQKAEFSKAEEFGLNLDLIKNEKTKKILGQSDVLKDLFKIMLGSLRKKRNPKKEGAIMTTSVIEDFNKMIDKIQKIAQEETDGEFKTFEDYLKLKQMNEELYIGNDLEEMVKEEVYLNFKEFTNISKVNINEALKVPHKEQGKKKVNIFVGRFQPFTLGHAKVFKQLHDLNGLPVHVLLVRGGKPDPEKRPFDEDAQQRMFQAMQKQYPFLSGSTVIPNGAIDTIYSALRPAYEPAIWGYGTDRKKAYGGMIDKQSYRDQLGVLPDFKGHEIKRGDEDISASKVRQALKVDDRKTFERMVPKSLHDFYEELQNILVPIEENVNERRKKGQMVWDAGKSWGAENKVGKKQYFPKDEDDSKEKANQYANPEGKIETGDSSPKMGKLTTRVEDKVKEITDPTQKKNAEAVLDAVKIFNNPDASMEDKVEQVKKLNDAGLIFMNSDTAKEKKMYLDNSATGLERKDLVTGGGSPNEIQKAMEEFGFDKIKPEGGKIGVKEMTAAKLFSEDKVVEVKTNVLDNGIQIGTSKYEKTKVPSDEKLLSIYKTKEEADLAKKYIERRNKIVDEAMKSFKEDGMSIIEPVPNTPPTSAENRKKLKDATSDRVVEGFEEQFKKTGRKPNAKQKEVLAGFSNLKDIKDPKEYEKELHNLTEELFKDDFYDTATKDVVEMVTYMSELNKGNEVYMPAKSNYPLGDIISISPEKVDFEKDSPEEIQRKMQLIFNGVEARSIKKGAGGASASGVKTDLSEFKEVTNKKGEKISPKQVKNDLSDLSNKDKLYKDIYDGDVKEAEKNLKDLSEKYDFDLNDPEFKERRDKSVQSAIDNISNKPKCEGNVDKDLKQKLENYYNLGEMYESLYNENVDEQLFVNEQYKYTKTKGLEINTTDGIKTKAKLVFSFSSGSWGCDGRPGNTIPTRFKNDKAE
tara:strand:- start:86 stop:3772 length:3687 start_codon:yes stop_codon:yes gene_type:complete